MAEYKPTYFYFYLLISYLQHFPKHELYSKYWTRFLEKIILYAIDVSQHVRLHSSTHSVTRGCHLLWDVGYMQLMHKILLVY